MNDTIDELIANAAQKLAQLGYVPGTITHCKTTWKYVRQWCTGQETEHFGPEQEAQIIKDLQLDDNILTPKDRGTLRHIRMLLSLNQGGQLPPFSRRRPEPVPAKFLPILDAYMAHLQHRGLAQPTLNGNRSTLRKFLIGLKVEDFAELSMAEITAHMDRCAGLGLQTKAGILYSLRSFTQWAANQGYCRETVATAMPIIPGHKHSTLPSTYAVTEVAAMISASEQSYKRDRAMLLLASILGLRAGEIRALHMENIDWRSREVRIVQPKTGNPVKLPLPEEVMLALIDYLRSERPTNTDPHVFLHHRAPHHSFEHAANPFHYVASAAYQRAEIETTGKHHGMHSLRHSAATNMLSGGTPYPVISGILGHSNANTTRKYMAIDIVQLRPLSLEIPRG